MKYKIYLIKDAILIESLVNEDLNSFLDYLQEDEYPFFEDPIEFMTQSEALSFCEKLSQGKFDSVPPTIYPLRSFEPVDKPFIEAIERI